MQICQFPKWGLHACAGSTELVPCKLQEVLAAGEKLTDAWTSRGALWGAAVAAGAPLHVRVQVGRLCALPHPLQAAILWQLVPSTEEVLPCQPQPDLLQASNSTCQSRHVELSVSCHDGSHLGAYERAFDTSAALATGNVTGEPNHCLAEKESTFFAHLPVWPATLWCILLQACNSFWSRVAMPQMHLQSPSSTQASTAYQPWMCERVCQRTILMGGMPQARELASRMWQCTQCMCRLLERCAWARSSRHD